MLLPFAALRAQRPAAADQPARILEQLTARYPCPVPVPAAWAVGDSSLATQPRCALVAASVAALRTAARDSVALPHIDLSRIVCVRVHVFTFRDPQTERIASDYWSVEFYSNNQSNARAVISRQTGRIRVGLLSNEFGYSAAQMCRPAS